MLFFFRHHLHRRLSALLLLVASVTGMSAAESTLHSVTIAVVRDGDSAALGETDRATRHEIQALAGERFTVRFVDTPEFNANWQPDRVAPALASALTNPSVDYVLTIGTRSILAAADPGRPLTKPVIGALAQEPGLTAMPLDAAGRSEKPNFAIVTITTHAADQLQTLRGAVPFSSLLVLADEFITDDHNTLENWREQLARTLGTPVKVAPLTSRADEALALTRDGVETVLLLPAVRMDETERAALFRGLVAQQRRVLGFLGEPDVEAGALAGVLPEVRTVLARRVAINLDQLVSGIPATELPLRVAVAPQLFFNEATAAAIGFTPDMKALATATLVGRPAFVTGTELDFTSAVLLALEHNYDYQSRRAGTTASQEAVTAARGALLPQVAASQYYQQVDRDSAALYGGVEGSLRAGLRVTQTVIDDETLTRLRIARESYRAADLTEQIERLDTINGAAQAYLQLLSARASLRVTEENARVTRHNLELARLRQRVGTAGPEEGFRFESLSAQQRADLAEARSQVERARVALNRSLGVAITSEWDARDVTIEDPAFAFSIGQVAALVNNRTQLEQFRAYLADYAVEHSPDLAAFEQQVRVQRLTADQKSRRSYVPRISASFDLARTLDESFTGPDPDVDHRNEWTFALSASLPLFSGGSIRADARRAHAELNQLELSRDSVRESVIAQAQATFYAVESAFVNIDLTRHAADLAARNLAVVQEKYEQGTVSIVTLLDAQNSAFSQRESAEVAVYRLFSEILNLERVFGWFEMLATPDDKAAWLRDIQAAIGR